ncbi:MFS transporter [Micromonospora sp. GCM10011542]|uniref:MFS transporter n=1 Tax=Micromonospora sp. GCM10011542 TaxID=3317337 RepID=UPI0036235148
MTSSALGRDFRLLWSAAVCSRFGDALRTPALALLATTLTRDPRVIAAVTVAGQLPPLLFGLLGGVYADRWDRRRTMALVDGVRAAVVAALAVAVALDRAGIAALLVAALLLAALGTLFDAASFALLPALVPPAALPRANGRLQAGTALAGGFLGAPAAGVLFAAAAALPFALDAVSFAVAALLVLALNPAPTAAAVTGARRGSVWSEIAEGVRWLRGHRIMWRVTLLAAASNLAISGLIAVLVLYALDVLRVPPSGYGLFAAAAILGGVAGALGAGWLAARLGTVPALRAVLAGQTVALTGFALARHPVPGGLALAVFAAGTVVWNSLWASYGQRHVPAGLLGRVGAAQRMVGLLTAPVGAALAGLVAAAYGTVPVAGAAAGTFALVTLAAWRMLRPVAPVPPAAAPTSGATAARPAPRPSR